MQYSGSFCTDSKVMYTKLEFEELELNPEKRKSIEKTYIVGYQFEKLLSFPWGKKMTYKRSHFFF